MVADALHAHNGGQAILLPPGWDNPTGTGCLGRSLRGRSN